MLTIAGKNKQECLCCIRTTCQ